MDKRWRPEEYEEKIYQLWEKGRYFTPRIDPQKKPFSILLPLPNANDSMHIGHAMYVIEDILCRWHRMMDEPTLWLPGADHAGIETQFVFEKKLREKGQSRFDFDRKTLYQKIWDFVEKNRRLNKYQLKKLGFSLDWSRYHYSLEPKIVAQILKTFKKLHRDGLVYRGLKIVNYCPHCGTSFSNLEVEHPEKDEFLYYLDYGPIQIATTRPETIFADVAVAVNPKDKRHQKLIGQKAVVPLINKKVPVITDELVEIGFGTGALKITPGHDQTDFEIGQRHKLPIISCVNTNGKMINVPDRIKNLNVKQAKKETVKWLQEAGKLIKTEPLKHKVSVCYRCHQPIEPLPSPQWFVKTKPLAKPVIEAVKKNKTRFVPRRFRKTFLDWMNNIRDWNISRQVVWGPRIPAWYCLDCNSEIKINFLDKNKKMVSGSYNQLKNKYSYSEIKSGLQSLQAPVKAKYNTKKIKKCPHCGGKHLLQETDTFDTWFLSGQWPLTTLGYPDSEDFQYFYPTSVLDTMWDILFFWVARMMIFGLYLAKDVPFKVAHLHSRVVDKKGQKMSKSKGNVINPLTMSQKYGADALRMALVYGTAPASDIVVSEEKIKAMRNFGNKIWNASRFVILNIKNQKSNIKNQKSKSAKEDREILEALKKTVKTVNQHLKKYRFGQALEEIYQFFWHKFCDVYLEQTKNRKQEALPTLIKVLITSLKLIHPFAPFVTEAIYQELKKAFPKHPLLKSKALIISQWPNL